MQCWNTHEEMALLAMRPLMCTHMHKHSLFSTKYPTQLEDFIIKGQIRVQQEVPTTTNTVGSMLNATSDGHIHLGLTIFIPITAIECV